MANNALPQNVDILIIGTGLNESILSAALSCMGFKILHIDSNSFYGGLNASFSFQHLIDIIENKKIVSDFEDNSNSILLEESLNYQNFLDQGEIFHKLGENILDLSDIEFVLNQKDDYGMRDNVLSLEVAEKNNDGSTNIDMNVKTIDIKHMLKLSRSFNIDLCPKLLMAGSSMFKLLLSSNTSKYLEFQRVNLLMTMYQGKLVQVPCNRSQIFRSDKLSIVEKRSLMKLISFVLNCDHYEIEKTDDSTTFMTYLQNPPYSMTPRLIHFLTSAITFTSSDESPLEGVKALKRFCSSLELVKNLTYTTGHNVMDDKSNDPNKILEDTNTEMEILPYLFPVFGSGELPQAFCRLSAVYGSSGQNDRVTFVLNTRIDGLILKKRPPDEDTAINNQIPSSSQSEAPLSSNSLAKNYECTSAIINGQKTKFKHVIIEQKYRKDILRSPIFGEQEFDFSPQQRYPRAIFLIDYSLCDSSHCDKDFGTSKISFLHSFQNFSDIDEPNGNQQSTESFQLLELSHVSYCVPIGYYLYHVTSSSPLIDQKGETPSKKSPREVLEPFIKSARYRGHLQSLAI
ncbi:rab proteins geranylgeranyltransferase component A 1-like isoform X2 [Gordionus sp. m RMFG-2023]|uniref:rab proteins geranylgeranyltransferase component A 1-like isoform X2 n=1 Tax=Gordionus sp. m RMFG-2023 TaxID=3053472 RepID=UPI0031FC9608